MPLKFEKKDVTEFFLARSRSECCFGVPPAMNELISVKMRNKGAPMTLDAPVIVRGRLRVGAVYHDGMLESIYAVECEQVTIEDYR